MVPCRGKLYALLLASILPVQIAWDAFSMYKLTAASHVIE